MMADGREAIAHLPSMDMGGKLQPGVRVLLRTATDKKGNPVGSEASGKYGTPRCEFIMQLLRCEEAENADSKGCWVGAHPSIGEKVSDALIKSGALTDELGGSEITEVKREVSGVAGCDMRCDFLLGHADGTQTIVEVKTVVDTDYDPALHAAEPGARPKAVFLGRPEKTGGEYVRSAIFPWGQSKQLGPEGEKVVSARAIKHVRELTAVADGRRTEAGVRLQAAVLFVIVRSDAVRFRANDEACPSFARYIREARDAGVRVLAHRVSWGHEGDALGQAFHDGPIPMDFE